MQMTCCSWTALNRRGFPSRPRHGASAWHEAVWDDSAKIRLRLLYETPPLFCKISSLHYAMSAKISSECVMLRIGQQPNEARAICLKPLETLPNLQCTAQLGCSITRNTNLKLQLSRKSSQNNLQFDAMHCKIGLTSSNTNPSIEYGAALRC